MHVAWRAVGRGALLFLVILLVWGCVAASASEPEPFSGDGLFTATEALRYFGPTGIVAYFAYVVGKNNGLPVSITIQFRPEDREHLIMAIDLARRTAPPSPKDLP